MEPQDRSILKIHESISKRELVAIVGSGVSVGLTDGTVPTLSWKGLIEGGFAYGCGKGSITPEQVSSWRAQLQSRDIDDLISAAEFVCRKLEGPRGDLYGRWLENSIGVAKPTNSRMIEAVKALSAAEIPICTLNYDSLLEEILGTATIGFAENAKMMEWMRRQAGGILHLHGEWRTPTSCVLGIRDYETTIGNDVRDLIQRSLASFHRLLFIGCGDTFADPNFSALIKWLRKTLGAATPEHFALVNESQLAERRKDPAWRGFVEPVSYGNTYSDLPDFLVRLLDSSARLKHVAKGRIRRAQSHGDKQDEVLLLEEYRKFLIKDCGQMTIEGVRADMDIGQRRFDLERLFVPLELLPIPPEIPENEPGRAEKLMKWRKANEAPKPFGHVFAHHKHLALLALPGGGKTLLLKRLAVAYASVSRRQASTDKLPKLDLTPVLIRCREWREHIHRPIATLLKSIPEITGNVALKGVELSLLPLFKKGRALLLVDGLDEIHDDALRSTFVEHLEAFIEEYKQTRLVVTSREAGFSLVAPTLSRFCQRWRVGPLNDKAIYLLCSYWHRLMTGDSSESQAEAIQMAEHLKRTPPLLRLAENPLLLTMLLVVKHGAGRLPPDRVSLYGRAVEVLLDTWNIKGHDPLNPKEAVPQLAFIALQLMRAGRQTATKKELLVLIESSRENVPQIRRYAKDTPDEFLRRVELRSSLLVEAGHQLEDKQTVPFYQFRHLTFQEYLTAVAVAEGNYLEYKKTDTVLNPLAKYLLTDEWKEVIPMAAVLARKQAEQLLVALVEDGNVAQARLLAGEAASSEDDNEETIAREPASVSRLLQCFVEEAEASPDTLTAALKLIALFARGCDGRGDWSAICRGPYGEELIHQTWLIYSMLQWPDSTRLINTFPRLAVMRHSGSYWVSGEGEQEIDRLLSSECDEDITRGLFTLAGLSQQIGRTDALMTKYIEKVERYMWTEKPALWAAAARAWGWIIRRAENPLAPSIEILNRLLSLWLSENRKVLTDRASFALLYSPNMHRHAWTPVLSARQMQKIRKKAAVVEGKKNLHEVRAGYMVGFHSGKIWPDGELTRLLRALRAKSKSASGRDVARFDAMLAELGKTKRSRARASR